MPENLGELSRLVRESGADIGMAVDPDVDRLALVDERGEPIGEDYTLAFAVRAVLGGDCRRRGRSAPAVVANLSTSLVVEDAARDRRRPVRPGPGRAKRNVARMIRDERAVIGGEGNGGVILPSVAHRPRRPGGGGPYLATSGGDGAAGFGAGGGRAPLPHRQGEGATRGGPRRRPTRRCGSVSPTPRSDDRDGLRLAWPDRWVHVRPSGTEPIIRFIAEAPTRRRSRNS